MGDLKAEKNENKQNGESLAENISDISKLTTELVNQEQKVETLEKEKVTSTDLIRTLRSNIGIAATQHMNKIKELEEKHQDQLNRKLEDIAILETQVDKYKTKMEVSRKEMEIVKEKKKKKKKS